MLKRPFIEARYTRESEGNKQTNKQKWRSWWIWRMEVTEVRDWESKKDKMLWFFLKRDSCVGRNNSYYKV